MSISDKHDFNDLEQAFRMSNDGDDWGAVMSWLFALADYMTEHEYDVPEVWEFRQALGGADTDDYQYEEIMFIQPSGAVCLAFGLLNS